METRNNREKRKIITRKSKRNPIPGSLLGARAKGNGERKGVESENAEREFVEKENAKEGGGGREGNRGRGVVIKKKSNKSNNDKW